MTDPANLNADALPRIRIGPGGVEKADPDGTLTCRIEAHRIITALRARLAEAEARAAYLQDALRLIELFGYREGEDFGWINAHMRGVATSALSGEDLAPHWRLFPHHRPPAAIAAEAKGGADP